MSDQARGPDGRFAEQSFSAVYDVLDREVRRLDELRSAEISRLDGLRQADQLSLTTALTAAEKAVTAALVAAKEAVNKAEVAQQRTNEGQNEFRAQLKDQAATFMTRGEFSLTNKNVESKIADIEVVIGGLRSRLDIGPPSLGVLQARSDEEIGRKMGSTSAWTTVIAVSGASAAIAGALISLIFNLVAK